MVLDEKIFNASFMEGRKKVCQIRVVGFYIVGSVQVDERVICCNEFLGTAFFYVIDRVSSSGSQVPDFRRVNNASCYYQKGYWYKNLKRQQG